MNSSPSLASSRRLLRIPVRATTVLGLTVGLTMPSLLGAQAGEPAPAPAPLDAHVRYLASAPLEGRLTGSPGEELAADYLVEQLRAIGAVPLPGHDSFLHSFDYTSGSRDGGTTISIADTEITGTDRIQALSLSESGIVEGDVVFAGYGLKVPDSADFGYDSYATLDVKDKIVVVLRYVPEGTEGDVRSTLSRYSGLRYKALLARERGAKALILVTGPNSVNAGEVMPMTFDTAISGSGIVAVSVNGDLAEQLFAGAEQTLADAQTALDSGNPHVTGFDLGKSIRLDVKVERETRQGTNVIGMLPAPPRDAALAVDRPFVMVGAHFDHLGRGGGGNSLADADERNDIHYGADDNASGTAAVLDIARRLATPARAQARKRSLVMAFWSGEELGLLGATAFTKQAADGAFGFPLEDLAAYVNFDMVGRSRDNKLSAQAVGSSDVWPQLLEQSNVPVGFDLSLQDDPYLPTDSAAFHRQEIPTLNFFTGSHVDYHKPGDTADKINYDDLGRVAQLGSLVVRKLVERDEAPTFQQVQQTRQDMGSRDTVRAFTGTIPDYSTEVDGLLLGGVMAGGPAEEAGLRAGDVIVQFGSTEIKNIYDYTYALDGVKVDVPLQVVYLRDGERHETTMTPRARK